MADARGIVTAGVCVGACGPVMCNPMQCHTDSVGHFFGFLSVSVTCASLGWPPQDAVRAFEWWRNDSEWRMPNTLFIFSMSDTEHCYRCGAAPLFVLICRLAIITFVAARALRFAPFSQRTVRKACSNPPLQLPHLLPLPAVHRACAAAPACALIRSH